MTPDDRARRETERTPSTTRAACLTVGLLIALTSSAWAQVVPTPVVPGDPTLRSGEQPPIFREEPRPGPPPEILPPAPRRPLGPYEQFPRQRVLVRDIRINGSTVLTQEEQRRITEPYLNRELTAEDLEAIRVAITLAYVNKGYINSGAILPDQRVESGVVTYQVIEGALTGINVRGNRWFRSSYLEKRVALDAGPPLNVNALQQRLQLMLDDSRIKRLNAELKPGLRPGESELNIDVDERLPFRLIFDINNHQPPSVGAERGLVTLAAENLTGNGDVLSLRYGKSEGVDPLLDFRYALPFTARDTTLILGYQRNTFNVVEEPFDVLEIESTSEVYTVTLRQPVYRTLNTEVALELTGERLSNETTLFGEPFTLLPGAVRGESVVTAVRTAQEWVYRTTNNVLAARSRFSLGVDVLDATTHSGNEPDSRFFAWLGQFQWLQRFPVLLDSQLLFRTSLQLANDSLLALEQVAIGGRYSVRGYRENTLVRDNAFLGSIEARIPVVQNRKWADYIQIAPFYDYGRGWNTKPPSGDPLDIQSVGVGLRWALTVPTPYVSIRPEFEIYWGHPLRKVVTPGGNPQDDGIHFQFILAAY